jgi:hypothetical protein
LELPQDERLLETLKLSYDNLKGEKQKSMFLDAATIFRSINSQVALRVWKSLEHGMDNVHVNFQNLLFSSLVKVDDCGDLIVHARVADMARRITLDMMPRKWQLAWPRPINLMEDVRE